MIGIKRISREWNRFNEFLKWYNSKVVLYLQSPCMSMDTAIQKMGDVELHLGSQDIPTITELRPVVTIDLSADELRIILKALTIATMETDEEEWDALIEKLEALEPGN